MQGQRAQGVKLLAEMATLVASLSPAKKKKLIQALRDTLAALDADPHPASSCNSNLGRVTL